MAGWNQVDLTPCIQSDLSLGHSHAVFNIPRFTQVQDQNRILSFYGPGSTIDIDGTSGTPYLEFNMIPEPASLLLLCFGLFGCLKLRPKARQR